MMVVRSASSDTRLNTMPGLLWGLAAGVLLGTALCIVAGQGRLAAAVEHAPTPMADAPAADAEREKAVAEEPADVPQDALVDEFESSLEDEFAKDEPGEVFDPLSGYNRAMTVFNDKLYFWFVRPVGQGYGFVTPQFVRRGFDNFFDNLLFPERFVNNLLQFKLVGAGVELVRFTANTTLGIVGLWDPAQYWFGLEARPEDFGQTLGNLGIGGGPHLVLPVFGPSNVRDAVGMIPDSFLKPVSYVEPPLAGVGIWAFDELNYASLHIGEYENLKHDALDLYPFLRDVYEQNRAKQISE